jgi:hypothetical protein
MCSRYILEYMLLYSAGEYNDALSTNVSEGLCSITNSGGPRLRVLGDDHTIDAMPKTWLSDGCMRELGRSRE